MDLIRIYCEIAFSRVAGRYLAVTREGSHGATDDSFILPEDVFIDEARIHHPEISDDNLRMIYLVGRDDWSHYGFEGKSLDACNIFQVLACLSCEMLEDKGDHPLVHFKDLLRWREITQLLGEDLLTCAFLSFCDRHSPDKERDLLWPSVIHNDNPHLEYLFRTKRLCELHSHLMASTNIFEISWVSLMNHIGGLTKEFEKLGEYHEPSRKSKTAASVYNNIIEAACLRWRIYRYILHGDGQILTGIDVADLNSSAIAGSIDGSTGSERGNISRDSIPDYIYLYPDSPMSVYAGERWLLYHSMKRIYATNNAALTALFYRYVLIKSRLRGYFVQINKNVGFSNFQRFQNLKSTLLHKDYRKYLISLPLWEAKTHNFTDVFESRIAPVKSPKNLVRIQRDFTSLLDKDGNQYLLPDGTLRQDDWDLIFHFIKRKDKGRNNPCRDFERRNNNRKESRQLARVAGIIDSPAIDSASSEIHNRPEVFSQPFRFLRHFGYDATFHAGEDFHDLADGLRAIEEAILFLQLRASDRIGHALALGIDANRYYATRHNYIVLPKQWMLDNAVWLLTKTKEAGVVIAPDVEWFLWETYKELCSDIGYFVGGKADDEYTGLAIPDIYDYRDSMLLRGDDPDVYAEDGEYIVPGEIEPETWDYYSLLDSARINRVRQNNRNARKLYYQYHSADLNGNNIRKKGSEVKSFHVPAGYPAMITCLQDAMIREISKRQICIECCPSSNVRIGRLDQFEHHPIFRFMPVRSEDSRYPLAVTVNTDDLGVFSTSLPNEYSLLALALLKKKNPDGSHCYSNQEVYDWISRVIDNSHIFTFVKNT